jgi:acetyl-CoA acetyltransferase
VQSPSGSHRPDDAAGSAGSENPRRDVCEDDAAGADGGVVAIDHPLGASRARYALVTMCIGIGQGIAAVIERVE